MKNSVKVNENEIKFFYNGIKVNSGKLQKCYYHIHFNHVEPTIEVCAREYTRFTSEVRGIFSVVNGSDSQTDYFEKDRFTVDISNEYLSIVCVGALASLKRELKRRLKLISSLSPSFYYYDAHVDSAEHIGYKIKELEEYISKSK